MTNGYAQWAPHYRAKLWTGVLPLPPRAKAPVPKGWTGRGGKTPDDDQISAWCRQRANGNIALRMPGDVLGIDVDDYAYTYYEEDSDGERVQLHGVKTGGATLAALEAELGPLPPTWRSSSRGEGPSGIRFFRVPPGLLWGDFGTHLEGIWWGHRYAVVYPSINPDSGLQYLWRNDADDHGRWGAEPPKITELTELPESWTARFGRAADAPRTAAAARAGTPAPVRPAPDGRRRFTRAEAAAYVQPSLDALRAAPHGSINNRLNDAAKVMSHFVPLFWSPLQAQVLLMDALSATSYDHPRSAENTVRSAMDSSIGDWQAELRTERPVFGAVPAADSPGDEPPAAGDPPEAHGFWDRHPVLRHAHDFATAHETNPWAVLGVALARVVAATEPNIQLPGAPVAIGTEASLNMFVALVSESGGGKTIAAKVSRKMLDVRFGMDPLETFEAPLGSGEGLAHVYMRPPEKPKARRGRNTDDEDSELIGLVPTTTGAIQHRTRAFIKALEVDQLDAVSARKGSTLSAQLRTAWDGDELGFHYADPLKRMMVPEMGYRMSLVLGVQPGRAGPLLAEADGGLPQRFLWLPASNPDLAEYTEDEEPPDLMSAIEWHPPVYQGGKVAFGLCEEARHAVKRNHRKNMRGDGDALSSHGMLTRLKVAAALAMLLRTDPSLQLMIDEEVWELSGVLMAKSDRTRDAVQRYLAEQAKVENEKRGYAEGQKAIAVAEVVENDLLTKAVRWIRTRAAAEPVAWRTIQQGPKSLRGHLPEALAKLLESGEVVEEEYQSGTRKAKQYRRVDP
jgi:hypothetical protein